MGQTTSDLQGAVDEVAQQLDEAGTPERVGAGGGGTKLYKYVKPAAGSSAGSWQTVAANVVPHFYDANEDTRGAAPLWHMEVSAADIDLPVNSELQYVGSKDQFRVTFQAHDTVYALKFADEASWKSFLSDLQDKSFFNTYGVDNDEKGRAKVLGEDYSSIFFSSAANSAPMEEDIPSTSSPSANTTPSYRERSTQGEDKGEELISGIVIGALDRSYAVRGGQFDALRNVQGGVDDDVVSFKVTPLKGAGAGTPFSPSKILMSHGEKRLNMLNAATPNRLFHADIEYQKVVSEWGFEKDSVEIPIQEISNDTKASQLEDVNTFMGLDSNRLCRWDLRDPTGVVQASPVVSYTGGKDYARGTNFTCMATSGDGYVVIGSKDGKIRLYNNKTLTQAKTSIPGLGCPITAVDVTFDGQWVLATTDDYLLVIKTTFVDPKTGSQSTGFKAKMGKAFPTPRLLRLKPEDRVLTGSKPLRNGKFTWITEQGRHERWIVASCGNYSVVWNFRRVKTATADGMSFGGLPTSTTYHLNRKEEDVVAAGFMHDNYNPTSGGGQVQDSLVVATPHKVFSLASEA